MFQHSVLWEENTPSMGAVTVTFLYCFIFSKNTYFKFKKRFFLKKKKKQEKIRPAMKGKRV